MPPKATLFRVQGPRGIYFAIYAEEQKLLFTEANEKGARDHAAEAGLTLVAERSIKHADLMRLTGRELAQADCQADGGPVRASQEPVRESKPLEARLPRGPALQDADVVVHNLGAANPFATSAPLEHPCDLHPKIKSSPEESLFSKALDRDVISARQPVKRSQRGNPFSDRSQK